MLVSLSIHNIALIEKLDVELHSGMNVFSGETGAGKSIIIDSVGLVLGGRADRGLIRSGSEKAWVEAMFDISRCPGAVEVLKEMEIEPDGNMISLYREITTAGRSICRVCGVIVSLSALKNLCSLLVDVHGQHEHQRLLDERNHIVFLDSFGDEAFQAQKARVSAAYSEWKNASAKFSALRKENATRAERESFLKSRIKELNEADIETGEADRLSSERERFSAAEKINASLKTAYGEVFGGGRENPVSSKIKQALGSMQMIEHYDPAYQAVCERLKELYYNAEELGLELRELLEKENFDPEHFEELQERLDMIRKLERRYGMTGDELVHYRDTIQEELSHLSGMEDQLKNAERDFKEKLRAYRECASALTAMRKAIAEKLQREMENQLSDLGMTGTQFACVFEKPEDPRRVMPSANGDDHVVFYISPNPGEPLKPLDRTASGGELSRLMLAFKAAAANRDSIPCMIFDEIDTGISGRIAGVVADKMGAIARYHQVLCITHLAQIAAMADREYLVHKEVEGDRTFSHIAPLEGEDRVKEIARLIGVTEESQQSGLAHAREILESAAAKKRL